MRLLVTGTNGQIATALHARAASGFEIIRLGRPEFDLAAPHTLGDALETIRPDVIVNAAAYTAVDKAESDSAAAYAVNAAGAGSVAAAAARFGISVIQISTDYVFDGSISRPLRETDTTGPVSVYGASKLAGEQAVARANSNHAILRTAWVYAPSGANFVRTMLRLASTRDEVRVVSDQYGTPTSALDIAATIEAVARHLVEQKHNPAFRGIFNMSSTGGPISWAEFATEIFRLSALYGGPFARVSPITTADYPTPARRPAYSCLDSTKLATVHGVVLPDWKAALALIINRIHLEGHWT